MTCSCVDCQANSKRHRELGPREAAIAGAYWLGMLGFALAAPAATERALKLADRYPSRGSEDRAFASWQIGNAILNPDGIYG